MTMRAESVIQEYNGEGPRYMGEQGIFGENIMETAVGANKNSKKGDMDLHSGQSRNG